MNELNSVIASQALQDLGSFGVPHIDSADMPEGFTSVQVCSDLPDDIDPGKSHWLLLTRVRSVAYVLS